MRATVHPTKVEPYRIVDGEWRSSESDGMMGAFIIPGPCGMALKVIVSDGRDWADCDLSGESWDHVSVSLPNRCPNWIEMSFVKNLFFEDEEVVMELHVAKSQHINAHPNCLHLWRPHVTPIPLPPARTVA